MSGICVYCELTDGMVSERTAELVMAASTIKKMTGGKICMLLVAERAGAFLGQLSIEGVDEICVAEADGLHRYATDRLSDILSQMISEIKPDCVLVPASHGARAVFSRVAAGLGIGMTADCTGLSCSMENGKPVIKQNKPSFGAQAMVCCEVIGAGSIITITAGAYKKAQKAERSPKVRYMEGITGRTSAIRLLCEEREDPKGGITDAEYVVCVGRGVLEANCLELAKKFADRIGAAVGGTRPLADNGFIPFDDQVGQTGCVIRPKVCITLGISGAIQFTEGIKGSPLLIAVNQDSNAAIFHTADYAVVGDVKEILEALLEREA